MEDDTAETDLHFRGTQVPSSADTGVIGDSITLQGRDKTQSTVSLEVNSSSEGDFFIQAPSGVHASPKEDLRHPDATFNDDYLTEKEEKTPKTQHLHGTPHTTNSCTENSRAIEGNPEDATYSASKDIAKMDDTIVPTQGKSEENTKDETMDDEEVEDDLSKDVDSAFSEDLEGSLHVISDEIQRPTKENEEDILKSTDKAEASEQHNLPTTKQDLEQKFTNYKERTDSEEGLENDTQKEEEEVKERSITYSDSELGREMNSAIEAKETKQFEEVSHFQIDKALSNELDKQVSGSGVTNYELNEPLEFDVEVKEKHEINEATEQGKSIVSKEENPGDFSHVASDNYNPNSSTRSHEEESEAQKRNENYLEELQKSIPRDGAGEEMNIIAASFVHDHDTDEMLEHKEDANISAKVQEQSFNGTPLRLVDGDSEHNNTEEDPEQKIDRTALGEKSNVNTDTVNITDGRERNQVENKYDISSLPEISLKILELEKEIAGNDDVVLNIKGLQEVTEEFDQDLSLSKQKHEGTEDVESEGLTVSKEEKLEQSSSVREEKILEDTQQSKAIDETSKEQTESTKGLAKDVPEEKKEEEVSTVIPTISEPNFKEQSAIGQTKTKKPEEVVFLNEASEEHQEMERDPEEKIKEIVDHDINKDDTDLINIVDRRGTNQVDSFDGEPAKAEMERQISEPQQETVGEELQEVTEEIDQHFYTAEKNDKINEATEQGKPIVGKEEDPEDFSDVALDNYSPNSSTSNHEEGSEEQMRNENYLEEHQKSVPKDEAGEGNIKPASSVHDHDTDEILQHKEDANTSAKVQEQSFTSTAHYILNGDSEHKDKEEDPEQKRERIAIGEKSHANADTRKINDGRERNKVESTNNVSGVPEISLQILELKEIARNDEVVKNIKEGLQEVTEEFDQHLSLLKQKHEGTEDVESGELSVCKEEKLEQSSSVEKENILEDTQQSKAKYETNTEQTESNKGLPKDVPEEKKEAEVSTNISSISESNFKAQSAIEETKTKKPEEAVFLTEASEEHQETERDPEEKIKEIIDRANLVNIVDCREANQVDSFDGEPITTEMEAQIWEPQQEIVGEELQKVTEEIDQHFYTVEKKDQINEETEQGKPIVGKEEDLEDFSDVASDKYNPNSSTSNHEEETEGQIRNENYLEELQKRIPRDEASEDKNIKPARLVSAASSVHDHDTDEMLQNKEDANTSAKFQEQSFNSAPHYLLNGDSEHKDTEEDPEQKIERIAIGEKSHVNTDTGNINDGAERNQVESTNNISSVPEIRQQILELHKEIAGNDEVVLNIKEGRQEVTEEFDQHLSLSKQKHEGTEDIESGELSVSKDEKLEQSSVKKENILEDAPQIKAKYETSKEQAESSKGLAKDVPEEKKEEEVSRVIFSIVESNFRAQSATGTKKSEEEAVFLNEASEEHQETERDPEEKMKEIIDHLINKYDADLVNIEDGRETNQVDRNDGEPTKTEMEGQIWEPQQEIVSEELQEVTEEIDQHFYPTEKMDKQDKEVTEPGKLIANNEEMLEESSPEEFKESNIKLWNKQQNEEEEVREKIITCLQLSQANNEASEEENIISADQILEERAKTFSRECYEKDLQDEKEIGTKENKNNEEASNFPKNKDRDEQDRNAAETNVTNYNVEGKSEASSDNLMKNVAATVEESNKPDAQEEKEDGQKRAMVQHEIFDSISLPQRNDASKDQDRENDSEQEKEEIICETLKHENIDHGMEKASNQSGQFDCFANIPELPIPKLQEIEIEGEMVSNMKESIQIMEDINEESSLTKHTNEDKEASQSSQFNASKEEKAEQTCHVAPIEIFGSSQTISKAIKEMTENHLEDIKQSKTNDETSKEHIFISSYQTCKEKFFQDIEGTNSCKGLEANAEGSLTRNECTQEETSKPEKLDEGYYLKTIDKIHAESRSSSFKGSLNESPWIDDAERELEPMEKVIEPVLSTSKRIHEGMEVTEPERNTKIEEYETTKDLIPRQAADDLVEKRTLEAHHMAAHTAPCVHDELGYDSKHAADPIKIEAETENANYSYASFYKDMSIGKAAHTEASKINVQEDVENNDTTSKESQICFEELNVATPAKQNEIARCERDIEHSEMKVEEVIHIKELENEVRKTTIFEDEKRDADLSLNVQQKEGNKLEKDETEYDVIYEEETMKTAMPDKSYAGIQASAHRAIPVHKQIPLEVRSCTLHDDSYGEELAYKRDDKFTEGIEDDIINQMENKPTTDDETTTELGARLTVQWDTPSKGNNTQALVEKARPDPESVQTKGLLDDYTGAKSNICPQEELKFDSVVDISHQGSTFEGENPNINAKENLPNFEIALSSLDASVIEANQRAAFEAFPEEHAQILQDGNSEERTSSYKGNNETLGQGEMEQGAMKKQKESVPLAKTPSEVASSIEYDQNAYLDEAGPQANSEVKVEVINLEKNLQNLNEVIQIEPENDNFGDAQEKQYSVSNLEESCLKNGNGMIQESRAECETNIQSNIAIYDRDASEETLPDEKIETQDEYKDLQNDTSYRQLHAMPTERTEEAKEEPHSSQQMEEMGLQVSGKAEAGEKSLTGEALDDKLEEEKSQEMDAILQGHKIEQAQVEKDTKKRTDKDGSDGVQQFDTKVLLDNSVTELTMEDEHSGENQGDQIDSAIKRNETANDETLTMEIETDSTAGEDKFYLQDETEKASKITFDDGKQIFDTDQPAAQSGVPKSKPVNYENPANKEAQHVNDKQEVEAEQSSMQDNRAQQKQIHERNKELDSKWSKENHGIASAPEKTNQEVQTCTASVGETIQQVDHKTEQISIYDTMIDNPTDIGVELLDDDHLKKGEIYSGMASAEVEDLEDNSSDVHQVMALFEENMQINECEVIRKDILVEASDQEDSEKQTEESELAKMDYISKDYSFPELEQHEKSMQNVSAISKNVVNLAPEETDSMEPSEELAHETIVLSPKEASSVLFSNEASVMEATNKEESIVHETAMVGDFEGEKKQHFDSNDLPASRCLMEHVLREEVEKHHRCHVEQENEAREKKVITEETTAVSLPFEHKLEEKGTSQEAGPQKFEQSTNFDQEEKNSSEQDETAVQLPSEHASLDKYKPEEAAAEHITLEQNNNPTQGKQNNNVKTSNAVPEENSPSINELIIETKSSSQSIELPTTSKLYEPTVLQESTLQGPIELFFYGEDITNKDGNGMEVLQDVRSGKENSIAAPEGNSNAAPEEHAQILDGNSEEGSSSYEGNNESIGAVEMEQGEMKKQKESVPLEKTPSEVASSIECDQNAYLDKVGQQANSEKVEVIKVEKNLQKLNEVIQTEPENDNFGGDVQEKQYSVSNLDENCLKNGNGNIQELRAECETNIQSNIAIYGRDANEEPLPDEKIDTQDEDKDLQNDASYRQLLAKPVEGIEEAKEAPHSSLQMEETGLKVTKNAEAGEKSLTGGTLDDKLEGKSEGVDVILQGHKIEQARVEKDTKSRTDKDGRDEVVEQFDTKVLLDNCVTELTMEDEHSAENQQDQINSAIKTNETANDEILTTEIETDSTADEDKLYVQDETQEASKIAFDDGKQIFDTDQSAAENGRPKSKPVNDVYENPANEGDQHMNDKQEVEAEHLSVQAIRTQQNQIHERDILKDNKFGSPTICTIPEESRKNEAFGENSSVNKNKEEQEVNKGLVVLKAHEEKEIIEQTLQQVDQKTDQTSIYDTMTDNPTDIGVELVDDDHFKKEESEMASAEIENMEDNSSDVHQVIASFEENMQINECELIRKDILVEASDQEDSKKQTEESELAKMDYKSKDYSFSDLVQNEKSMQNVSDISQNVMVGDFEGKKKQHFDSNDLPVSRFLMEHVLREEVEKQHRCHVEQENEVKEKKVITEEMTAVSLHFEHKLEEKGTSQEAGPQKFEQSTDFDHEEKNSSEQDETAVQLPSEHVSLEKYKPEEAAAEHITLEQNNNPMQGKQNNNVKTSNEVPEENSSSINELIIETKSSSRSIEDPTTSKLYEPTVLQESALQVPTELFFSGEGITNKDGNGREVLQEVRRGTENSNAIPEENSPPITELIIETKASFQSVEHLTNSKELKPADTNSIKKSDLAKTTRSEMVDSKAEVSQVGAYAVEESCATVSKNKNENIQTETNQELEESTDEEKDEEVEETHNNEEAGHETSAVVVSREADVKPSHKKSHNILAGVGSKVKHSIAKVKKAIIGKSSHSKTSTLKGEKVVHHG